MPDTQGGIVIRLYDFNLFYLLAWLISGILAGWLTGLVVKGQGFGLLGDLGVGLLGGLVGGWLFSLMGLTAYNWLGEIVVAVMGGISLVVVIRLLRQVCQKAVISMQ